MVFKSFHNEHVLFVRKTRTYTYVVKKSRGCYRIIPITYGEFRRNFKPTLQHEAIVAEQMLNGLIKLTEAVKKELEMQVAIHRNKIVAKLVEDGQEWPEGTHEDAKVYTREDLEGKSMKELVKLYNVSTPKADRVKVIPGVEGDINEAVGAVWAKWEETEVAEKAGKVSVPREEKVYTFVKAVPEDTKMPTQARAIVNVLEAAGEGLKKSDLVTACDGKIETKQDLGRIVAFYQKRLVDEGFITMS
jgi:hypothetical protein